MGSEMCIRDSLPPAPHTQPPDNTQTSPAHQNPGQLAEANSTNTTAGTHTTERTRRIRRVHFALDEALQEPTRIERRPDAKLPTASGRRGPARFKTPAQTELAAQTARERGEGMASGGWLLVSKSMPQGRRAIRCAAQAVYDALTRTAQTTQPPSAHGHGASACGNAPDNHSANPFACLAVSSETMTELEEDEPFPASEHDASKDSEGQHNTTGDYEQDNNAQEGTRDRNVNADRQDDDGLNTSTLSHNTSTEDTTDPQQPHTTTTAPATAQGLPTEPDETHVEHRGPHARRRHAGNARQHGVTRAGERNPQPHQLSRPAPQPLQDAPQPSERGASDGTVLTLCQPDDGGGDPPANRDSPVSSTGERLVSCLLYTSPSPRDS